MGKKETSTRLIRSWNKFAKHLVEAEEAWVVHQKLAMEAGRVEMERLPVRAQKFVSVSFGNCNLRCKFNLLIPRLITYARTIGGLKEMVIASPKPTKKTTTLEELRKRIETNKETKERS